MNIYSLLTAIVVCITVLACVIIITARPFSVRVIRTVEVPKHPAVTEAQTQTISNKPSEVPETKEIPKEAMNMDGIIKSVNELMGIDTISLEDN